MNKKVIVISGASRGLGLELSKRFIDQGHIVFGLSKTKKYWPQAEKQLSSFKEASNQFILTKCDISKEVEVKKFFQMVRRTAGSIDILINNAGYGGNVENLSKTTSKEFSKQIELNLFSVFLMCKYGEPLLQKKKKSLLINISSMAGTRGVPRLAGYSAAKFGVLGLTQALAKENLDTGLKAITICPGGMNTKMRADLFGKADASRQQTVEFVADVMIDIIKNKIKMPTGSDIIIRHGKVGRIYTPPNK